jgi:hypothetical protein
VDLAVLMPALLRRSASGQGAGAETACAIDRLRAAGRWPEAHQLWLNTLPRERLKDVGFVFNGSFEFAPTDRGFDWILQPRSEREAGHAAQVFQVPGASGKRALRIAYNGRRQNGVPVRQFLALAPGRYEVGGMGRPDGIKAARGIHWTVRCVESGKPLPGLERVAPLRDGAARRGLLPGAGAAARARGRRRRARVRFRQRLVRRFEGATKVRAHLTPAASGKYHGSSKSCESR